MGFGRHACAAFGAALLFGSVVSAQTANTKGLDLTGPEPSSAGSEWFYVDNLDLRGHLRVAASVDASWVYKPLIIWDRVDPDKELFAVVRHQVTLRPQLAVNVLDRLRLELQVPVVAYSSGDDGAIGISDYPAPHDGALGDIRLSGDVLIFGEYRAPFRLGASVRLHLPTGADDVYATAHTARLAGAVNVAGDIGRFFYGANLGVVGHFAQSRVGGQPIGSQLTFNGAVGVTLVEKYLTLGPELSLGTAISHKGDGFFKETVTPIDVILNAHSRVSEDWVVSLGGGRGINGGIGAPQFRGLLALSWIPEPAAPAPKDGDADGVADAMDQCPAFAAGAQPDTARPGCPIQDQDHDGVSDENDRCVAEVAGPHPDPARPGCALVLDTDSDGTPDSIDTCPQEAAGPKADPQRKGCPAPSDQDSDGVVDAADLCPTEAVTAEHADPARLGCNAPIDTDGDGVFDPEDQCPKDSFSSDSVDPTRKGCPLAVVQGGQITIAQQIQFAPGTNRISAESAKTLEAVANILKQHPEIQRIRIEGHSDNVGKAWAIKSLSGDRASAVLQRLVKLGVEYKRLRAQGFGDTQPIASNDDDAGRALNRRVAFVIVDGPGSAAAETSNKSAPQP